MTTSSLAVMLLATAASAGQPWQPVAFALGRELPVGWSTETVKVSSARFEQPGDGRLRGVLSAELSGTSAQVGLVLFTGLGQPLRAALERLQAPTAGHPDNLLTALLQVRFDLGPAPAEAAWFAVGPVERVVTSGSLVSAAAGGRIVGCSSTYGGSYQPDAAIDDNGNTCWASETGKIEDEWLLCELAGGEPRRLAGIGINPKAEPNYPDCAVREFTVLASATDTDEGSFTELVAGQCDNLDKVQTFHFPPAAVRYLKLVCHTNYGSDKWMELTAFEAYAAEASEETAAPAVLVEDFGTATTAAPLDPEVVVEEFGFALLDLQGGKPARSLRVRPTPQPATWPVDKLAAKEGACTVASEAGPGWESHFGRLVYDFGNLLGGAPQRCGVVFDRLLPGRPTRLQWLARADSDNLPCGAMIVDREGETFELEAARLPKGRWQTATVELDPNAARYRGGEAQNREIDYPVRLSQVYVRPSGLKGLAGTLDLDDVMALSPVAAPTP